MSASGRPADRRRSPASAVLRAWASLYTAGLGAHTQHRRRAEIESDCWEHLAFSTSGSWSRVAAEVGLAWRGLRGIPSDLSWRIGMKRTANLAAATAVERTAGALLIAALIALVVGVVSGPGIDTREPYFRDGLSDASRDLDGLAFQAAAMLIAGVSFLVLAVSLAIALRPIGRGVALVSLLALGYTGLALAGYAALSYAVRELASAWGESAFRETSLLGPARQLEEARQSIGLLSILGPLLMAGTLGWTALRRSSRLPRWLSASAGALIAGALATIAIDPWAGLMLALIVSLVYLLIVAAFLLLRGLAPSASSAEPS